jgi:1,2-phenylacetyl-CoA epoxidase PaaB subunit
MTWAIKTRWYFTPVKVVAETEKMITYIYDGQTSSRRGHKEHFLDWRGDEEAAHRLCAKLTSAKAEYDRRSRAADNWFIVRKAEILASERPGKAAA